jgi:hypothetical protein
MHEVIRASAADIQRWQSDPRTPMYSPAVAASAPTPEPAAQPLTPAEMDAVLLGGPWRKPGMRRPPSGHFNIPPAAGSASDVQHSHMGCAAQKGDWWK